MAALGEVVRTTFRLLTFRSERLELLNLSSRHLVFGLLCAWLVGMGRYWDNPRVGLAQHLGLGSVAYVFVLALFLWLIVLPLKPRHWSYLRVCTFVSLVSPPAVLYAIPVEKSFSLDAANSINAGLLAIVAAWRVALLIFFLRRMAQLPWLSLITATLLPLTLIIVVLAELNLEQVVMDLMGGRQHPSPNDVAYIALFWISVIAFLLFVPVAICYLCLVIKYQVVDRFRRAKGLQ